MIPDLNKDTFMILAAKAYDKPSYLMEEFVQDLKRIRHIKVHINRYIKGMPVNNKTIRTVLNHIIILANSFGVPFTTRMLFYSMNEDQYPSLKSFLEALRYIPPDNIIKMINGENIVVEDINTDTVLDEHIQKALR